MIILTFILNGLRAQVSDSAVIRQVDSLIQISRTLTEKGLFEEALQINEMAENIALAELGRESAAYGSCCFNHGRVMHSKEDTTEAKKWYLESKIIREKVLGREHPDYASSLNNLASLYAAMGQYKKAEPLYIEAKIIREKFIGREHPDYASSLNNLANLYSDMGQYEKAEPLYLEAKIIREKLLGREHPDYAWSLNNLAVLYSDMGQYEKAEPFYLESKTIRKKVLGREHPDYAWSLNNLASLYIALGQYEKAELLFLETKAIFEKTLGKERADYAGILNNLASLYSDMDQYDKAEPLFLESKAIHEKVLGKDHRDYAGILNNLASLYIKMGQYDKAEPHFLESKAIREKVLGKDHRDYAGILNNLASLYIAMGQYEKAELLFLETKAILEKTLGIEHPDYATSLNNLANFYRMNEQYEKAELLFQESKTIFEKKLGREHPSYAENLINLAILCRYKAQYEKVEALCIEAKEIFEGSNNLSHPSYMICLINLAKLYESMGKYEKAEPFYSELSSTNKLIIEKALHHLSEQELNNYLKKFTQTQDRNLSFNETNQSEKMASISFDNSLFYKGFLLQAANQIKRLAMADSSTKERYNLLKSYNRRLAGEYSKPITERIGVEELEKKANDLEKDLARTVAGFGESSRQVNWKEIQNSLKEGEAAIEFVHYCYYDKKATDSIMYAALLLRKDLEVPVFVPLFEQRSLDSLMTVQNKRNADYVNQLYTLSNRGIIESKVCPRSLYELLWQPLNKKLSGIKTIYFSPSGLLHRINLGAIPISETVTLSEQYKLIGLNSTRQLVIPTEVKKAKNDAVLYGGIHFERDSTWSKEVTLLTSRSLSELPFSLTDSTLRGRSWNYLAGTDREVGTIEKLMQGSGMVVHAKRAYEATEESFKNIGANNAASPRILHIATHGYFFPDPKGKVGSSQSPVGSQESVFKMSDHPMLRSGLILAGGNAAWQGKQTLEGREDGILTAYEISQMNLFNTELVVLSACETGLGDIQGNEGVYGLQRAFKIAGAKYLIMSLWQVPDKQTSLLMTTFYKKWLEEKMAIPEAFHAAQKELREVGLDPYQWAGFVLVE
jgi:CHAT domain-containing protein